MDARVFLAAPRSIGVKMCETALPDKKISRKGIQNMRKNLYNYNIYSIILYCADIFLPMGARGGESPAAAGAFSCVSRH